MNNNKKLNDKSFYLEQIKIFEILKRLNDSNDDFKVFKEYYIDRQSKDRLSMLTSESIGHPERQKSIEILIGINNLKQFLEGIDTILLNSRTYLKEAEEADSED